MRPIIVTLVVAAGVAAAMPAPARAGRIDFDAGFGVAVGHQGIDGSLATELGVEGGLIIQLPVFVRLEGWELLFTPAFRWFAAPDHPHGFNAGGFGLHGRRYLTLMRRENDRRTAFTTLELYVRAGFDRIATGDAGGHSDLFAYGVGLQLGVKAGSSPRQAKVSHRLYLDVGQTLGKLEWRDGEEYGTAVTAVTLGMSYLGVGR